MCEKTKEPKRKVDGCICHQKWCGKSTLSQIIDGLAHGSAACEMRKEVVTLVLNIFRTCTFFFSMHLVFEADDGMTLVLTCNHWLTLIFRLFSLVYIFYDPLLFLWQLMLKMRFIFY